MEKLKDVGAFFGMLATISLERANLFLSVLVGMFTLLFLIPGVISRWRTVFNDFKTYKETTGNTSFVLFVFHGWLFNPTKKREIQNKNESGNEG